MPRDGGSSYDRSLTSREVQKRLRTGKGKIVAAYDYRDEQGRLLFQTVRFNPKGFSYRRPNGQGKDIWDIKGVRRVLYRLPEILLDSIVYIVEGEKDADQLWLLGLPTTTSPMGAKNWRDEYAQHLKGKQVVILPDNDAEGERYAQDVARSLAGVATSIKTVRLPGQPDHGDVSDWLKAGHTKEELLDIVERTPQSSDNGQPLALSGHAQGNVGLQFTSLGVLFTAPEEQVVWLVDGLLPSAGFSLLVGKPKAGKSTLARGLALDVARGQDFLGRPTTPGAVLYLALEEKRSEVVKHFQAMGATGAEDIYVHAASAPVHALEQLRTVVQEKKPALIIIDPLFRFTRVKDGNDYVQVTAALEPLLVLARTTQAHVLCVHHEGKGNRPGGEAILGSQAIWGAADTTLLLKRSERYRTLSSSQRYGKDMDDTVLHFNETTRTFSLGESKGQADENRLGEEILDFLADQHEPVTVQVIDAEVKVRAYSRKRALRQLLEQGKVARQGKGTKGDPYLYTHQILGPLVPPIYRDQENQNSETDGSPQESESYSRSQDLPLSEAPQTARDQESLAADPPTVSRQGITVYEALEVFPGAQYVTGKPQGVPKAP